MNELLVCRLLTHIVLVVLRENSAELSITLTFRPHHFQSTASPLMLPQQLSANSFANNILLKKDYNNNGFSLFSPKNISWKISSVIIALQK